MKNRRNTIAVLSILVLALMGTAAHAVTVERRWDGDNSTNRWGYRTNWTDDTTPNTIFESAVFDGNNGNDIQLDLGVGSSLEIGQIKVVRLCKFFSVNLLVCHRWLVRSV